MVGTLAATSIQAAQGYGLMPDSQTIEMYMNLLKLGTALTLAALAARAELPLAVMFATAASISTICRLVNYDEVTLEITRVALTSAVERAQERSDSNESEIGVVGQSLKLESD